jgi:hypothetical protein
VGQLCGVLDSQGGGASCLAHSSGGVAAGDRCAAEVKPSGADAVKRPFTELQTRAAAILFHGKQLIFCGVHSCVAAACAAAAAQALLQPANSCGSGPLLRFYCGATALSGDSCD